MICGIFLIGCFIAAGEISPAGTIPRQAGLLGGILRKVNLRFPLAGADNTQGRAASLGELIFWGSNQQDFILDPYLLLGELFGKGAAVLEVAAPHDGIRRGRLDLVDQR